MSINTPKFVKTISTFTQLTKIPSEKNNVKN